LKRSLYKNYLQFLKLRSFQNPHDIKAWTETDIPTGINKCVREMQL